MHLQLRKNNNEPEIVDIHCQGPEISVSSTIKIELPELKEAIGTLRNATS